VSTPDDGRRALPDHRGGALGSDGLSGPVDGPDELDGPDQLDGLDELDGPDDSDDSDDELDSPDNPDSPDDGPGDGGARRRSGPAAGAAPGGHGAVDADEDAAAERYGDVEAALLDRWPEARIDPTLDRIRLFCDVLGDPQDAVPVIHLTGTNGKTSTSRMTETLLRGLGLRTGVFTSPHLQQLRERIAVDGRPLSRGRFVEVYDDVEAYLRLVDDRSAHRMSFFEALTGMAYAAFADTPVDVAVVEVGLGGTWDATNVADGRVAVLTRIDVDHAKLLGSTPAQVATEKVGIIKAGAAVVSAHQLPEVDEVIDARVAEVGATLYRAGRDVDIESRVVAVGGQLLTIRGIGGTYADLYLPLHGAHQAENALCALVAAEAFFGGGSRPLRQDAVVDAFAVMSSPARLELVAHRPTVLLDAAHNPDGARATAAALTEAFAFRRLVGVVAVMADKDAAGLLAPFADVLDEVVVTENSTDRSMAAEDLAELAEHVWPEAAVHLVPDLEEAITVARRLAQDGPPARTLPDAAGGTAGVLVTGSVVTAGEARELLLGPDSIVGERPADLKAAAAAAAAGEDPVEDGPDPVDGRHGDPYDGLGI